MHRIRATVLIATFAAASLLPAAAAAQDPRIDGAAMTALADALIATFKAPWTDCAEPLPEGGCPRTLRVEMPLFTPDDPAVVLADLDADRLAMGASSGTPMPWELRYRDGVWWSHPADDPGKWLRQPIARDLEDELIGRILSQEVAQVAGAGGSVVMGDPEPCASGVDGCRTVVGRATDLDGPLPPHEATWIVLIDPATGRFDSIRYEVRLVKDGVVEDAPVFRAEGVISGWGEALDIPAPPKGKG